MTRCVPFSLLLLGLLLLPGCGQGQDEATTEKPSGWEYRVETETALRELGQGELVAGLNALGSDRWELAAIRNKSYVFKRSAQSDAAAVLLTSLMNLARNGGLMPPEILRALKLTEKQKTQYHLIYLEYRVGLGELQNPPLDSGTQFFGRHRMLRAIADEKVQALLTAAQRATYQKMLQKYEEDNRKPIEEKKQKQKSPAANGKQADTPLRKTAAIPFGDVVVNLEGRGVNRYLRVKILVAVEESDTKEVGDLLTKEKAFLKNWLIAYLSSQSYQDVGRKLGVNRIRREICDEFNARLYPNGEEKVVEILFDEFVVQ
jgi:flagellar basal body-associated protein FliL